MFSDIKGKTILITGGSGFLGKKCAIELASLGANLIIVDIVNVRETVDSIKKKYEVAIIGIETDLSKEQEIRNLVLQIEQEFGKLDGLVLAAAFVGTSGLKGWTVPFEEQSVDTWREALEVNLTANFILIQACKKLFKETGSIITIGSIYGFCAPDMRLYENMNMGNPAAYAVSKGGLLQLTKWLASVLAPKLRVNSISLGGIERGQCKEFVKRYIDKTPLKRMAKEEDVTPAVVFLLSDKASYITGQNMVIDGGWSIW